MPQLPTISAPSVQRAQYAGVPASLESALAPIRGSQAIAGAISDIGEVAQEFAVRAAQAKEAATLAEQQRIQKTGLAAFETELATTPNSEDWPALWEKHKKETQKSVDGLSKKLGTVGRQRSQELYANWATDADIKVKTRTAIQGVRESASSMKAAALDEWNGGGSYEGGADYIEMAVSGGFMSRVEADNFLSEGRKIVDIAEVNRRIRQNPAEATEWIKDTNNATNLSESERLAAINTAKVQTQNWRAAYSQEVGEKIFNVVENGGSPQGIEEEIKMAVQEGKMLASTASGHLRRLRGDGDPQAAAAFSAQKWEEAIALDISDPNSRAREMEIRAAIATLDPVLQRPILDVLEDKRKPGAQNKDIAKEAIDIIEAEYQAGFYGAHEVRKFYKTETEPETIDRFGWFTGDKPNPLAGKEKIDPDTGKPIPILDERGLQIRDLDREAQVSAEVAQNEIFVNRVKIAVRDWAKKNPDSTPEQQVAYARSLVDKRRDVTIGQQILDGLTGQARNANP